MIINTEALGDFARADLQISVTKESLFAAIDQVDMLADWMELRLQAVLWPDGDKANALAAECAQRQT